LASSRDLVSVIIPIYNSEKFLSQTIESVLNQTYKNIQVIAVDDGSTDSSGSILKKYSDRIKIIHQSNKGLASALKTALKNINGRWFKWFSPDDVLYPHAIETLVNTALKFPENTIVYSNWELIDEKGKQLRCFYESNYNELDTFDFNVRLLDGQQINVNSALIPLSLINKGCIIQELEDPITIDYDFFLRAGILYNTKFYLIPEFLIKYRLHSNQLSHQNIVISLSLLSTVSERILSQLDDSNKKNYLIALEKYKKRKPLKKKTLEFGLRVAKSTLPNNLTDKLILFYLNKIRRTRN